MTRLVLSVVEKDGLKYELCVTELDPNTFANAGFGSLEAMYLQPQVRVTAVDQAKQGT